MKRTIVTATSILSILAVVALISREPAISTPNPTETNIHTYAGTIPKEVLKHVNQSTPMPPCTRFDAPGQVSSSTETYSNDLEPARHCNDCRMGVYSPREDGIKKCSYCDKPES